MKAETKSTIKLMIVTTIGGAICGLLLSLVLVLVGVWADKVTILFATAAVALVAPVVVYELKVKKPQIEAAEAASAAAKKAEKNGPTPADLGAINVTLPYDEKFEDWATRNLFGPARNRTKGGALIVDLWLVPDGRGLEMKKALPGVATVHFTELCDGKQVVAAVNFME